MASSKYAPGARLYIRDEEWRVKRVELTDRHKELLVVTGVSPLVRGQERLFLTELETIEIVDPRKTTFVADSSPSFRSSRLYMESLFRQTPPTDERIYFGDRAAIDPLPFQMDPARQALAAPRQRILIADSVGLGKTIECGILLSELIARGRGKRILVLAVKSMLAQFQKELWARFTIPLVRLDSVGIERVRNKIPANHNPFYYYDKAIISIDTLKRDGKYKSYLENARWDIIVIDEAHNVAQRGTSSQRSKLAQLLSTQSDTLIMLSATPHDGSRRSFASLMSMLDATAIANPDDYGPKDIGGLFIRRFKKDIESRSREAFPERQIQEYGAAASPEEEAAFDRLAALTFARIDQKKKSGTVLFKTTLEKALFSSPAACRETIDNRIKSLRKEEPLPQVTADIEQLRAFDALLGKITPERFGKYQMLVQMLKPKTGKLKWKPSDPSDRVVIFTERIKTMNFLAENLKKDLGLNDDQVRTLHGTMGDTEMMNLVEEFGGDKSKVRLLICSDVASEGINLHYRCHRLIHFDIPWSLMVFQQRNGRIDRYGQEKSPEIYYLKTESKNEKIKGDTHILELLIKKDDQVVKSIGDPASFTHRYDSDSEEVQTAEAIQSGLTPEQFERRQAALALEEDPLDWFNQSFAPEKEESPEEPPRAFPTLFSSDYRFAAAALRETRESDEPIQYEPDDEHQSVSITPNEPMRARLKFLPPEILDRDEGRLHLCALPEKIKEEFSRCRASEQQWPRFQYLWRHNPIVEYLGETMLTAFDRQQAPVLQLANRGLAKDDAVYLTSAVIPNKKGQPVIYRWYGLRYRGGKFQENRPIEDWIETVNLRDERIANPMIDEEFDPLTGPLDDVVKRAEDLASEEGERWQERFTPLLEEQKEKFSALRIEHTRYIDDCFRDDPPNLRSRRERKIREMDEAIDEYRQWVEDSMTIDRRADIRVIAVLKGV